MEKTTFLGNIGNGCRLRKLRGLSLHISDKLMNTPFPLSHCEFGACSTNCCTWGCRVSLDDLTDIGSFLAEVFRDTGLNKTAISIDLKGRPDQPGYDEMVGFINYSKSTGGCLLLDQENKGACRLHAAALNQGLDWRRMKPFACVLYPVKMKYLDPQQKKDIVLVPSREHSICKSLTHRKHAPRSQKSYYEAKKEELRFLFDISE